MDRIEEIIALMTTRGGQWYGREAITLEQHSLQSARLAELEGAPPALVAAALLHDIGHLLAKADTGEGQARDDRHEAIAAGYLARVFGPDVVEPIRLHVDAKRYLSATEPGYRAALSPASVRSLGLQGGALAPGEADAFRAQPHAADAIRLRRWDDLAKDPTAKTGSARDYLPLLRSLARRG